MSGIRPMTSRGTSTRSRLRTVRTIWARRFRAGEAERPQPSGDRPPLDGLRRAGSRDTATEPCHTGSTTTTGKDRTPSPRRPAACARAEQRSAHQPRSGQSRSSSSHRSAASCRRRANCTVTPRSLPEAMPALIPRSLDVTGPDGSDRHRCQHAQLQGKSWAKLSPGERGPETQKGPVSRAFRGSGGRI